MYILMKTSFILISLVVLFSIINSGYIKGDDIPDYMLEGGPEWENYVLDEEAIKDKLYCRTTIVNGDIIETRWYNYFVNPNDVVRADYGDTTTPYCEYPNYEPVYASGSNEGKIYSRKVFDEEGDVLETVWHDACSDEIIKTDDGDTTYPGSNEFTEKCYHPDYVINSEETVIGNEETEEESINNQILSFGTKIVNWFKSLLNM